MSNILIEIFEYFRTDIYLIDMILIYLIAMLPFIPIYIPFIFIKIFKN